MHYFAFVDVQLNEPFTSPGVDFVEVSLKHEHIELLLDDRNQLGIVRV